MSISPESPNTNMPAYLPEQDKQGPSGPEIKNPKKEQLDQQLSQRRTSDRVLNTQVKANIAKSSFSDTIKSSANLSKLTSPTSSMATTNSANPQLLEPKENRNFNKNFNALREQKNAETPPDKQVLQLTKSFQILKQTSSQNLFGPQANNETRKQSSELLSQTAKSLANIYNLSPKDAKSLVLQARQQLQNPNINLENFSKYNDPSKANFEPLFQSYKLLQNLSAQKSLLNPKGELLNQATEKLSKDLGISTKEAQNLLKEVGQKFENQLKSDASLTKGLTFTTLLLYGDIKDKKIMNGLNNQPEFLKAASKEHQSQFESLNSQTNEQLEREFPGMKGEKVEKGPTFLASKKDKELESKFNQLLQKSNLSEKDQNILKTLFSRPELAQKYPEGDKLLEKRNALLKDAAGEVKKENFGSDLSESAYNSVMKDATLFSSKFEENLNQMGLDPETEKMASSLLTQNPKNVSQEAQNAYAKVLEETLSLPIFTKYKEGFSKTTLSEAKGFKRGMKDAIQKLDVPDSVKKELLELLVDPDKEEPPRNINDLFNELASNEGFMGSNEVHAQSLATQKKSEDNLLLIAKLSTNLRKAGANPSQIENFISNLSSGKISPNNSILKKTVEEVNTERGLPVNFTFETEEIKEALKIAKSDQNLLVQNGVNFIEDLKEAVNEFGKEMSSESSSATQSSSSTNKLDSIQISTGDFVKMLSSVSIEMSTINQMITLSNTQVQTKIQVAMTASTNAMMLAQSEASRAQSILANLGQYIEDTVIGVVMFVVNPVKTITDVQAGGGIGKGGMESAINNSILGQSMEGMIDNVIQPVVELAMKIVKAAVDLLKLVIILSPIGLVLFGPGFVENVQEEGFKDAINESLFDNFVATLEAYGVDPDSNLMVVLETTFVVVQTMIMVGIAIAMTIVTGGAASVLIVGAVSLAIVAQLSAMMLKLAPIWEEAGWINSQTEEMMKKVFGAIALVSMVGAVTVGIAAVVTKLPEMLRKLKQSLRTITSLVDEAMKISKGPKEFLMNLMTMAKDLSKSGLTSAEFFVDKKAMRTNKSMDDLILSLENASSSIPADDMAKYNASIQKLKEFQGTLPEAGKMTPESLDKASNKIGEIQEGLDQLEEILGKTNDTEIQKKLVKMKKDLNSLDRSFKKSQRVMLDQLALESKAKEINKPADLAPQGEGTSVTNADGSVTTTYTDGTVSVKSTDGSVTTTYADGTTSVTSNGTTTTTYPDETKIIKSSDGSTTIENPDGTVAVKNSKGLTIDGAEGNNLTIDNNKTATLKTADNTTITHSQDGTVVKSYPDGAVTTKSPDGTVTTVNPDGSSMETFPDGTVTSISRDGIISTVNPDGSSLVTYPDGTVTSTTPNGTKTTVSPNGTIDNTYPDGSGKSVDASGDITYYDANGEVTSHYSPPAAGSQNVLQAQSTATQSALESTLGNLKDSVKKMIEKIKKRGDKAVEASTQLDEIAEASRAAETMKKKKTAAKVRRAGIYARAASSALRGASSMYSGALNLIKSPLEKQISEASATIDRESDFIDIGQTTSQILQQSSQDATEAIKEAIKFFYQYMAELSQSVTGITSALSKK